MDSRKPLASKTRQIESIPLHVLKTGKIHLLPVYQLAALSSVGKELILNQGSARYQDLVYRNLPEGRLLLGKLFDSYLLPFEITSVLLLAALVGAVTLTFRKTEKNQ